jgi:hypothetical protein
MYNMDISLLGLKLNLEVLILIGIVYLIMATHTVCGCCNMNGMMEAFSNYRNGGSNNNNNYGAKKYVMNRRSSSTMNGNSSNMNRNSSTMNRNSSTMGGYNNNDSNTDLKNLAAAQILKEGFTGANTNYGQSAPYTLGQNVPVDTSKWGQQDLVVTPGQPLSPAVQAILNREPQPVPLPEGELLMFANTPFKPECCPNTYSNSMGCACMTSEQYNNLILRGGNNVPYSEY